MGLTCEVCELYPNITISYALFENVQNCAELKEKYRTEEIKVALINPKMVTLQKHNKFIIFASSTKPQKFGVGCRYHCWTIKIKQKLCFVSFMN